MKLNENSVCSCSLGLPLIFIERTIRASFDEGWGCAHDNISSYNLRRTFVELRVFASGYRQGIIQQSVTIKMAFVLVHTL